MSNKNQHYQVNSIKNKFVTSMKKSYGRFLKIRGNPREIALGFALGLFIGMTPYMGFHMAIAVFLASMLKWNKISAVVGVWISNPFTAPVIYGITYFIGGKLYAINKAPPLPNELNTTIILKMLDKAPEILWALTIGGIIIGLPIAIFGYYFSLSAILKYRERIKEKLILKREQIRDKRKRRKRKKKKKKKKKKK